jgi:GAF domain-containing protein
MVQQQEPNAYDKQLVALGRILQTLREEDNSDVLIDTVIRYIRAEFDYHLIWIGLYDRVEHRLFGKGGITPGGEIPFLKQRFSLSPGDLFEQVVIQQRPLAVPDLQAELRAGEWRKTAQTFNIQGTVIFPIRYKDHCYGVVLLGSTLWGTAPRSDEKARLSMILGGLATTLYQIEAEWQRQQIKHPDQPLIALLTKLRSLSGLGARLEAVVEEIHQFIQPSRTSIYWFERERRYFWRRVGNRQKATGLNESTKPASGITAQEVSGFYQALISDQIVSIGEAHSSLKADITSRLMQQIRARSLLAAPLLYQGELLGFLAVEGNEPRIWKEEEKKVVRAAAQMIGLTIPLQEMETTIEQIQQDQFLTATIACSIYSEDDWKSTLKGAADQLCKRLKVERFMVLMYDQDINAFEICYQTQPGNRRPLTTSLDMLHDIDWKMVETSRETIGIENLDSDLRLRAWRDRLLEMGIKSLLLCSTAIGHSLEGLLLIGHESPRTWNHTERRLVQVVSQQIGLILHQWQLQKQNEQQQKINQTIQWALTTIQQTHQLDQMERSALQHIAQTLHSPLSALVSWLPGQETGRLLFSATNDRFALDPDVVISVYTDHLIRWALEREELLALAIDDIPHESRHWLNGKGIGQVLVMALRTASEHEPTGMIVVADAAERRWSEQHLKALSALVSQLAWSRRYLSLTDLLTHQRENLQQLNWYKHARLEEVYRFLAPDLRRLGELTNPKDPLFMTRYQQILRHMNEALAPLAMLIQEEQWHLRSYSQTISLITLLKRTLERADEQIKQHQIWSQVHNESNLIISGDITKIEFILYELILSACQRSSPGGRIDIWCRQIDHRWLELSITDNGQVAPQLLGELEASQSVDLLAPSTLEQPPGLHLMICQSFMHQLGSECNFYRLEDGRILSRLVLPLLGRQGMSDSTQGRVPT